MTPDVTYCFEDEDLDDVVRTLGEQKVHRRPVMSREKRLVGIVSLGDVAVYGDSRQTDAAGSAVSEPGGPPPQTGGGPTPGSASRDRPPAPHRVAAGPARGRAAPDSRGRSAARRAQGVGGGRGGRPPPRGGAAG